MEKYFIGQEERLTRSFSAQDVESFARLSGDINPIHLDHEYAKQTIFKNRVVHGFLTASLISALIGTKLPGLGAIYLHQEMNFKKPVYLDDVLTAIVKIVDMKPEKCLLFLETTCLKNDIEVVIEGRAIVKYNNEE